MTRATNFIRKATHIARKEVHFIRKVIHLEEQHLESKRIQQSNMDMLGFRLAN